MVDLKPCPFCGSAGIIRYREALDDYIPECSNEDCIVSYVLGNSFQSSDEATEVWNRRVGNG